jgi:hypothetical protein
VAATLPEHQRVKLNMSQWFAWTDFGYLSPWSIMHFLSGYLWCIVWVWAFDDIPAWLNLLLFLALASLFEIVENQKGSGSWMWGFLGYNKKTYTGDTAINSVSDILISAVGWAVVRVSTLESTTNIVLGILLGVAAALFLVFLYLFRIERRIQLNSLEVQDERPALVLSTVK